MISRIQQFMARRKLGHHPALSRYLDACRHAPTGGQDWANLRFVVLDTETTGLDIHKDRVLSIGAVVVQHGAIRLAESLEVNIRAEHEADQEAIPVHGITPEEAMTGVEEEMALLALLDLVQGDVLVAHHVAFDAGILRQRMRKLYPGFELFNPWIDTAQLAMKVEHPERRVEEFNTRDYTLDALCKRYGIRMTDRHTAWGDAYMTGILFLKLLREMERQNRITLRSLMEY